MDDVIADGGDDDAADDAGDDGDDAADDEDDEDDTAGIPDEVADAEDPDEAEEEGNGDRQSLRWAVAEVGSYGYSVASMMVDYLNRELPDDYVVTVHPYPSTTGAMQAAMEDEAEISYTADVGMVEYYDRIGSFEDYEPTGAELVHTFYAYPMETFLVTPTDNIDDYPNYSDFDGEDVFFTPAGFMNWMNLQRMFDAMGYEFNHVEIDSGTVADALDAGSIVGSGAYTTAGTSLPTFWVEAELSVDVEPVQFSDEELAALEEAGLEPTVVDPEEAFSQEMDVDEILGVPILFGYNMTTDIDEDLALQMLEIFEEHADELVELDAGFAPLAEDFVGIQTGAIAAAPEIPVHPGLATFLQERDAWDDDWIIAD